MDVVIVVIISAVVLDLLIGDPRFFPHPVGGIAAVACWLERISQKVSRGQASVQAAAGFVTAVGVHLLVLLLSVSLVQQVQAFSDLCGALVTLPTFFLFGSPLPFFRFAAFSSNTEAGGVLITKSKERSA